MNLRKIKKAEKEFAFVLNAWINLEKIWALNAFVFDFIFPKYTLS